MAKITLQDLMQLTETDAPFVKIYDFQVESFSHLNAVVRVPARDIFLRPGGTIAGPVMMALADYALYVAILASIGPVPLAVTTNLNVNFIRKPEPGALIGEARLIKLGKRLAVGEVLVHSEHSEDMVAHATGTYSIPPQQD